MAWYYADGGRQVGPVEDAELARMVELGVVRGDTLVWRDGMAGWQSYASVHGGVPASPVFPAPAVSVYHYAGFWIRFVARLIDGIILGIVGFILRIPLMAVMGLGAIGLGTGNDPATAAAAVPMFAGLVLLSALIQIALYVVYEVYFLTTRGATIGKIALGLKVVRVDGAPISIGLAVGRYFGTWLSGLILGIGYIMAGFDDEKRALHDRLCETRVVYAK